MMYLENFVQEMRDFGEKDDKVVIQLYGCGKTYRVPMLSERIRFEDGKVIIVADDN